MGLLIWLEESGLAAWTSTDGYPPMIALHAIGMAVMVGLALALDMRLLGLFAEIPYTALHRFLGLAWLGFGVNFLSGVALFTTQATAYVADITFLLKMGFVVLGAITAALLQTAVGRDSVGWGPSPPGSVKGIAIASIVFWLSAIITGRLIAYL